MARRRPFKPGYGWVGLAGYVLGYDAWAIKTHHDTLTTVFRRAAHHPVRRWPVILLVGTTVMHLFDRLPPTIDPFHQLSVLLVKLDKTPSVL